MNNEIFMRAAIEDAKIGLNEKHGGPFGAAIAKGEDLLAVGHNTVLRDGDPTCHAEMNAIRNACRATGTHILSGCTLYTTAEPCPMCLSAILWARIDTVIVGVNREIAARYGFDDAFFYEQVALQPDERDLSSSSGCCQKDCEALFASWSADQGEIY
jgi:guanine deaminase